MVDSRDELWVIEKQSNASDSISCVLFESKVQDMCKKIGSSLTTG